MAYLWRQASNSNVCIRRSYGLPNAHIMPVIYINGIPIEGTDYSDIARYFSPQSRKLRERDIEDVEYEDVTETENKNEQTD